MAEECPSSIDVQDIQFKLHDRFKVFSALGPLRDNVNLLAVASNKGMLFAGNPNAEEFKVILLKDLVDAKTKELKLCARQVQLPSPPNVLATSADGSMLAVNYTINGTGFLNIYSVPSFVAANVKLLHNLRLSAEENVAALQLLWNPVLTSNLAVVLSNGALVMYTLKDGGNFEFHSLDSKQQIRCGCWSPKGKQIVLGFSNGKLQQFKPDLTPAKTIACPAGVHAAPFDTIAVHWLSTFQFIVALLQHGEEQSPTLYIVNAPKNAPPSYINYFDICYSATGPRQHQINFTHIQAWNLLIVTSANGVELGLLGTKESGELPTWVQYALLDEARIEMPLTESKDETYPIGFAFDTASTHQVVIGEKKLPIMPMVHVLSTHGHLVSFNFLNLTPNGADVCSPPPPIADASGMFKSLDELNDVAVGKTTSTSTSPQAAEISFSFNPTTVSSSSTPALKEKPKFSFGNNVAPITSAVTTNIGQASYNTFAPQKPHSMMTSTFGSATNATTTATNALANNNNNNIGNGNIFSGISEQPNTKNLATQMTSHQPSDFKQPLYTVPATYAPPPAIQADEQHRPTQQQKTLMMTKPQINSSEIDEIVKQMIAVQVNSFNWELQQIAQHSNNVFVNIGKPDELKTYTKLLNDLQEIVDQAGDRDFEMDVHQLRHSLNECYTMLAECRTKLDMYNNPDITRLTSISTFDPANRRQLVKLQSNVAANQAHLQQLQQQIDAQWANYQDLVRRNARTQMHIPCLDGIYQRMTKLKDLVANQRTKINYIKTKLKEKGLIFKSLSDVDTKVLDRPENTMESLADSILSMSLVHVVDASRSKLSDEKMTAIRTFLRDRPIVHIQPRRPDRVGLKSEVILETKLQAQAQSREGASIRFDKMQPKMAPPSALSTTTVVVTKPMASKSTALQTNSTAPPLSSSASLAFSGNNSLATKATMSSSIKSEQEPIRLPASSEAVGGANNSLFTASTFTGFGTANTYNQSLTFGQPKTGTTKTEASSESPSVGSTTSSQQQVPISFAAKVVNSEGVTKSAATTFASKPTTVSGQEKETPSFGETDFPKIFSFGAEGKDGGGASGRGDGKPSFRVPSAGAGNISLFSGLGCNKSSSSPFELKSENCFNFGSAGGPNTATIASSITPATATVTSPSTTSKPFGFGTLVDPKATATITADFDKSKSSSATVGTASSKAPFFSGLGKSVGGDATTTTITPSFDGSINLSASKAPISTVLTTTATSASDTAAGNTAITTEAADSLLSSLNICNPTAKEPDSTNNNRVGNMFGSTTFSFGASGEASKSIFAASATGSTFSFGSKTTATTATTATTSTATSTAAAKASTVTSTAVAAAAAATTSSEMKPTTLTTPAAATETAASSATSLASSSSSTTFSFSLAGLDAGITEPKTVTMSQSASSSNAVTSTTAPTAAAPVFGQSAAASCKPMPSTSTDDGTTVTTETQPTTTTTTASSSFGGTTSVFGTSNSTAPGTNASSVFGLPATTVTAAAAAAAAATTASGSIFASTQPAPPPTTASGNIFGGIPKPDQSVFGSPPPAQTASAGGLFAAAAATNPSPFSSPGPAASGGSIFGGTATSSFGKNAAVGAGGGGGSIFGAGGAPTSPSSPFGAGSSIFGGSAKPAEGANIFGAPSQATVASASASAGGSLFGQSTFGQPTNQPQSGSSIFGSTGTQQTSTAFGGSIFGGGASNATAGGSIFGGAPGASPFGQNTTGFGSFSQPSTGGPFGAAGGGSSGGSFAHGGASVAQSGFGSPQQQTSPFSKPMFGAAPAFGSPPAFGSQPSFGGAPSFGSSPKGFGSFAASAAVAATATAPAAASSFTSPTQKNSLFETLGSTETGLSFGNLAQTSTNAPKPTFGGSSFMNYRA